MNYKYCELLNRIELSNKNRIRIQKFKLLSNLVLPFNLILLKNSTWKREKNNIKMMKI